MTAAVKEALWSMGSSPGFLLAWSLRHSLLSVLSDFPSFMISYLSGYPRKKNNQPNTHNNSKNLIAFLKTPQYFKLLLNLIILLLLPRMFQFLSGFLSELLLLPITQLICGHHQIPCWHFIICSLLSCLIHNDIVCVFAWWQSILMSSLKEELFDLFLCLFCLHQCLILDKQSSNIGE